MCISFISLLRLRHLVSMAGQLLWKWGAILLNQEQEWFQSPGILLCGHFTFVFIVRQQNSPESYYFKTYPPGMQSRKNRRICRFLLWGWAEHLLRGLGLRQSKYSLVSSMPFSPPVCLSVCLENYLTNYIIIVLYPPINSQWLVLISLRAALYITCLIVLHQWTTWVV